MQYKEINICSFRLEQQRFAIDSESVCNIIRALAVTEVPEAPSYLYGVMNLHGEILPVINLRNRLNFPELPIRVEDHFLICHSSKRKLVLVVDEVYGVETLSEVNFISTEKINPGLKISRMTKDEQGIILIYDLEELLNSQEEIEINRLIDLIVN